MFQPDLQQILDHFDVGQITKSVWADFGWMINTNHGAFLIVDLGAPVDSYLNQSKLAEMVAHTYTHTKLLLLPNFKGDISVRFIHQQGHYFSIYQIIAP